MSGQTAVLPGVLGVGTVVLGFLVANWATTRASRAGLYGMSIGSWAGLTTRPGDPFGVTARVPAVGAQRTPVITGNHGQMGRVAVVEERGSSSTTMVCYLWIDAGLDADVVRRADGVTERTHGRRGGIADRLVREIGANVPQALLVWTAAGSAPPPTRDELDRGNAATRLVGLAGDGPVGAVGLALRADLVTNPVAWLRWLRDMVYSEQDGDHPPSPPSVGFS